MFMKNKINYFLKPIFIIISFFTVILCSSSDIEATTVDSAELFWLLAPPKVSPLSALP